MSYEPENINNEVHEELADYYTAQGHQIEVFTLRAAGAAHRDRGTETIAPANQPAVKVHTLFFPKTNPLRRFLRGFCQWLFQYNYFLELIFGLRRFLREHDGQYDVIHIEAAYPLGTALELALALNRQKTPTVINLQGADVMSLPRYDYGYGRYPFIRRLLRYTFKRASAVRPNSYYTQDIAFKLGANPAKTQTILRNIGKAIYPSPELDLVANKQQKAAELRRRYDLNPGPILMAYGRLHPFKGVEFLVRAVPIIKEKYGPVNLLICGPSRATPRYGDYRRHLEKLAQELGVQEEIIFTGRIEFAQSRDYLAGADLLIVPSVADALNKVATEAAAVATPSVLTETTGVGRHAAEAGVALLVKPASESALADGVIELLKDPARRAEMGARGPAWARHFTSQHVGDQLLALYQKAIKASSEFRVRSSESKIESPESINLSTQHSALSTRNPEPETRNSKLGTRLCYVAYPSSLVLKSANGIQTFSTVRELKRLAPDTLVLLPKLPGRASAFTEVGARHLLRIPFNFFSNFPILKKVPWGYLERSFFANEAGLYLLWQKLSGRPCRAIYVRDVICAYWLVNFWRLVLGAKVIYEAHDLEARNPSRARGKRLSALLQKIDRTILAKADGVVSLTEAFKAFLGEDGWRDASRPATVIPDAYDANVYKPLSQAECRKKLDIAADEFAVVYAGLTFAYRGLDRMVEAFGQFLKESQANARLYFVGGRPFEIEQLREVIKGDGLEERVRLIGPVGQEQVNLWLNAASLTVIPDTVTDITASPLKMFEYAAVARPVLLPDLPALREILGEDEAIYFERGNRAAITAALCRVYTHPDEANARGQAAAHKVAAHTYQNRAQTILNFVKNL
jgi:glycosyltransferase involved in cell wall biosynthesis